MPYTSEAQRRYFHANKAKLEAQGVSVDEWDKSSEGKDLPERSRTKLHQRTRARLKKTFPNLGNP